MYRNILINNILKILLKYIKDSDIALNLIIKYDNFINYDNCKNIIDNIGIYEDIIENIYYICKHKIEIKYKCKNYIRLIGGFGANQELKIKMENEDILNIKIYIIEYIYLGLKDIL